MKSRMIVIAAVVAGLLGGLLGSFLTHSRGVSADSPPTKIKASEVDIVDGAGHNLIRLYSDNGGPAIAMQTAAGSSSKAVTLGPTSLTFAKDGRVYAAYPRY